MLGLTETSARSRPSTLLAVGAPKLRSRPAVERYPKSPYT